MTARHLDLARQAYGYNTTIPPLYTLAYYNAIANGGKLVRPHLTKRLLAEGMDSTLKIDYIREQVCSPETAKKVKECLREPVWGEHGTARAVRDERVMIAGKTGTAQNPHGRDHSAFMGFAPYDDPKIAVAVYVENAGFGATYGVPIGSLIIEKYLNREISPARLYLEERMLNSNTIISSGVKKH
jgi:penicillin-binding protein 2